MKKVLLIFPPFLPSAARHPYLSVNLLAAFLERGGHQAKVADFNLRSNRDLIDLELYSEMLEHVKGTPVEGYYTSAVRYLKRNGKGEHVPEWIWNNIQQDISEKILMAPKTLEEYFQQGVKKHPKLQQLLSSYIDEILAESSDIVAFSVAFGEQLLYALEMIKEIKEKSPKTVVYLGGAQISLLEKSQINLLKENIKADLIFQGYAEDDLCKLVEAIGLNVKPLVIQGSTSTREKMKGYPHVKFDYSLNYNGAENYPVLVTKGCYWGKCEFCDYILMGDLGGERFLARPVEEVFEELKYIRSIRPDCSFTLVSDAVPPKWYKDLAKLANKEGFKLRTNSYMINNKAINEEFYKEISEADIRGFTFGTEATSDRLLRLMNKQATQKVIIQNLELARKYGIKVKINLIPNYPTATLKEAKVTYNILSIFSDAISSLAVFKFYLSANTSMFRNPSEFKLEIEKAPYLKTEHNGFHTVEYKAKEGMTPEEEELAYAILRTLDYQIKLDRKNEKLDNHWNNKDFARMKLTDLVLPAEENGQKYIHYVDTDKKVPIEKDISNLISKFYDENFNPLVDSLAGSSLTKEQFENLKQFKLLSPC